MKSLKFNLLIIIIAVFFLVSCSGPRGSKSLMVSTRYASSSSKSISKPEGYSIITGENSLLLNNHIINGNYQASTTPVFMFLDLGKLEFFNTEDIQENIFNTSGEHAKVHEDWFTTINMLSTNGLSSYADASDLNKDWHHLTMVFPSPWVGKKTETAPEEYEDPFCLSIVGVELPSGIDKENLGNDIYHGSYGLLSDEVETYLKRMPEFDNYAWFAFADLVPFDCHYPAAVVFSDTIDTTRIFYCIDTDPSHGISHFCIGNGNPNDSSNMSIIEIPMETINFSGYTNPELTINYYAKDLIEFYEDNSTYYAYFNPENPFPLSVSASELDYSTSELETTQVKATSIEDAVPYYSSKNVFKNDNYITLLYTMPNYAGITGVEIYHNTIDDLLSAQPLYSGSESVYRHRVSDVFGPHYYWIRTVSADGSKSAFIPIEKGFKADKAGK